VAVGGGSAIPDPIRHRADQGMDRAAAELSPKTLTFVFFFFFFFIFFFLFFFGFVFLLFSRARFQEFFVKTRLAAHEYRASSKSPIRCR